MTKEEVLKAIRNHSSEIRTSMGTVDYVIASLTEGYKREVPGEIDSLKDMMSFVGVKADEIKVILDQWPS